MKLIAALIAAALALLFVASAIWINDVPRKPRMFETVELRGKVDYGFPLVYGSVEFIPDFMSDEEPVRLLHSNLSKLEIQSVTSMVITLGIMALLTILNVWGVWSVCRDSVVITVLCAVFCIIAGGVFLLCLAGAVLSPNELTLLDEVAMLVCVIWLAFAIVSLRQMIEAFANRTIESFD